MDPGFILGFIVQLILRNGFIFLSRLVDRVSTFSGSRERILFFSSRWF